MKTLDDFPRLENKKVVFVDTFFKDGIVWSNEHYYKRDFLNYYLKNCIDENSLKKDLVFYMSGDECNCSNVRIMKEVSKK